MDFIAIMLMACANPSMNGFKTKKQCENYHLDCVKWMQIQPEVQDKGLGRDELLLFLTTQKKKDLKKICG